MNGDNKDYFPEVLVVSIDVLGMSEIVEKNDMLDTALRIIGQIEANAVLNSIMSAYEERLDQQYFLAKQFGDSIYLIGNPNLPQEKVLQRLILTGAGLIIYGIFGDEMKKERIRVNFLLRCGIAKGNLKRGRWKISEDIQKPIYIGNSMSHAHYLEERQEWIGGAINGDINCSKIEKSLLVKYPTDKFLKPISGEWLKRIKEPKYVIDWIKIAKQNEKNLGINIDDAMKKIWRISNQIGDINESVREKICNTSEFIDRRLLDL